VCVVLTEYKNCTLTGTCRTLPAISTTVIPPLFECEHPNRMCDNNTRCIKANQLCDGRLDCWDKSDEGLRCGMFTSPSVVDTNTFICFIFFV
jgi:hypothetical protein